MTDEKIREVLDRYEAEIVNRQRLDSMNRHLLTMIPTMREMTVPDMPPELGAEEAAIYLRMRREKLMRWLGFLQGALWSRGVYTIDDLKAHNKPDDEA